MHSPKEKTTEKHRISPYISCIFEETWLSERGFFCRRLCIAESAANHAVGVLWPRWLSGRARCKKNHSLKFFPKAALYKHHLLSCFWDNPFSYTLKIISEKGSSLINGDIQISSSLHVYKYYTTDNAYVLLLLFKPTHFYSWVEILVMSEDLRKAFGHISLWKPLLQYFSLFHVPSVDVEYTAGRHQAVWTPPGMYLTHYLSTSSNWAWGAEAHCSIFNYFYWNTKIFEYGRTLYQWCVCVELQVFLFLVQKTSVP